MKKEKQIVECLDFLRNNKDETEEFNAIIINYLEIRLKEHIEYHIEAGFTYDEIIESFKGITFS